MRILWLKKQSLFFTLLVLTALSLWGLTPSSPSLSGDCSILIDPGHGGIDPGGSAAGIAEKGINLAVAQGLRDILAQQGVKGILTRDSDADLSNLCNDPKVKGRYRRDLAARIQMARTSGAGLFISIHANTSTDSRRHGVDVFYHRESPAGKMLAEYIHSELAGETAASTSAAPGDYYVLRQAQIPAALIEVGYLTNDNDRELLQSAWHRHKLAQAIARGIARFHREASPR